MADCTDRIVFDQASRRHFDENGFLHVSLCHISKEQVAEYYKASDVFISASRSEGFPYSVAEAMGANLPIISSDIPGVAWAKQAKGVLLFESGNAIALSQAIQGVLSWPEQELQDRKQSNQQFIVENYTVEKWAKNIIDVYITIQSDDENL